MQPFHSPITMSIFELLKAGPGPSSSHTIAPMRAGADFAARTAALSPDVLARVRGVRVKLWGSLSATGHGHGTDRAVIAGLMGYNPETCPPALLSELFTLPREERVMRVGEKRLPLGLDTVVFGPVQHSFPFSNTLVIELLDEEFAPAVEEDDGADLGPYLFISPLARSGKDLRLPPYTEAADGPDPLEGHALFSMEYYSTGGGFLQWEGWEPEAHGMPRHRYVNMRELQVRLVESGLTLDELLLENEMAITGASEDSINRRLDSLLCLMKDTVRRGCEARGELPGNLGLRRKAGVLFERANSLQSFDQKLCLLNAYAYAASEENAAGHIIVTTPTCGAAGVVPAIAMFMQEQLSLDEAAQRKGLLAAAAVGFIAKQNAGIAGAEVGCQGEIGVASAMAAAMLAHARGYSAKVVENAAEIALEHHLGLTCDPVGGYVQIPCIERNAVGAVKAYNAALIACNENPAAHMVSYDDVLRAMAEIGRDMNAKYKETSTGGLAVCLVAC